MTLLLYDTLSAACQPLPPGPVTLYVCGVTPYDTTHLGHAFTFVQFDVLNRALRWLGRDVVYVQNVTDIDDSILQRAHQLGVSWRSLGDEQTAQYQADMQGLGVVPPTHYVRATDSVATMHRLIAELLQKKAAYTASGGMVYFRIAAAPQYGDLSRLSREQMLEIAAQQDDADLDDPRKQDPLDFALWKGWSGQAREPAWESPWGLGRPGWHIECSAMCLQYLGPTLTIHGGGSDLIYPHHESEIAQSELANDVRPFAHCWWHVAMVRMDGAKMSKSLGNMIFIRDLLPRYGADAVRLYLLEHHRRTVFEWSEHDLLAAQARAERLALAARQPDHPGDAPAAFTAALENDLDTPGALDALETASGAPLRELAGVLGLGLDQPV